MRRIYFAWTVMVFAVFGTSYGSYLLVWHYNRGNGINAGALVLLIFGIVSLIFSLTLLVLRFIDYKRNQHKKVDNVSTNVEEIEEFEEPKIEEPKLYQEPVKEKREYVERSSRSSYSYSSSPTVYVKEVGYGPILRVEGSRILDMRNNTYYRIENNMVNQEGYGPIYEIRGNQIKDAFGGYLYEISGSNINKVFGGFFASISGNYINIYDLSRKFEMDDQLSKAQLLSVIAILFGKY